ncbi:hypothetical protein ANTPLA_LOCUS6763 [Anthophora plagiata]
MSPKMSSLSKRTAKAKADALPWDYYVILQDSPVAGRISSLPSEDFVENSIPLLNQVVSHRLNHFALFSTSVFSQSFTIFERSL